MIRSRFTDHSFCCSPIARRGFTLVELLVVVTLMSILTGMFSIALSGARQEARIKRAKSEVRTISLILQQKINDIGLAPVRFLGDTGNAFNSNEQNRVTMLARRDVVRMMIPQCRADLIYPPARLSYVGANPAGAPIAAFAKIQQPSEWAQMRRISGFLNASGVEVESQLAANAPRPFSFAGVDSISAYFGGSNDATALRRRLGEARGDIIDLSDRSIAEWPEFQTPRDDEFWTRDFEAAECLYLVLATTEIYGQRALDQFSPRSIANLDGDAVPEIIDPWGVPYEFIRDPVGRAFRRLPPPQAIQDAESNPSGPDSFDYLRTDVRFANNTAGVQKSLIDDPFRLSPIIVSAGPDGEFGMRRTFGNRRDFENRQSAQALADHREYWFDRMGVSPRYSTAVTAVSRLPITPRPLPPVSLGTLQYPDAFMQFRDPDANQDPLAGEFRSRTDWDPQQGYTTQYDDLSDATLAAWYSDGSLVPTGLGAALVENGATVEEFSDNIASDDPE